MLDPSSRPVGDAITSSVRACGLSDDAVRALWDSARVPGARRVVSVALKQPAEFLGMVEFRASVPGQKLHDFRRGHPVDLTIEVAGARMHFYLRPVDARAIAAALVHVAELAESEGL